MSGCAAAIKELRAELDQVVERKQALEQALGVLEALDSGKPNHPWRGNLLNASKGGRAPKTCSACGGSGHNRAKCPEHPTAKTSWTCKACGSQGHTARSSACPLRAGQAKPTAALAFAGKAPKAEPVITTLAAADEVRSRRLEIIAARARKGAA